MSTQQNDAGAPGPWAATAPGSMVASGHAHTLALSPPPLFCIAAHQAHTACTDTRQGLMRLWSVVLMPFQGTRGVPSRADAAVLPGLVSTSN